MRTIVLLFIINTSITYGQVLPPSGYIVDTVYNQGKENCLHEWRNNAPEALMTWGEVKDNGSIVVCQFKRHTRICVKCIRRERISEVKCEK